MRARIWGARGSLASPGPRTVRYGGNTSCVEIVGADVPIVLDAGTGIRELGLRLAEDGSRTIHLLLTHLHLDHLEGLAFFAPLWDDRTELEIWGPPSPVRSLRERIARYLSPPLFPRHLSEAPARVAFHDAPATPWQIGGVTVTARPVSHPGPTLGYRLERDGRSLAYVPDHEPLLAVDLRTVPPEWVSGYELARGATVLLHDAQYFADEYFDRVGWGHSSVEQAVAFALIAQAGRLVLFHHDPYHADDALLELEREAAELWLRDDGVPPELAYEGMTIDP